MKLKNKINLYTVGLFVILLIIVTSVIYFLFSYLLISAELERTKEEISRKSGEISQFMENIPRENLLRAYVPVDGMVRLVDSEGEVVSTAIDGTFPYRNFEDARFYMSEHHDTLERNGLFALSSMPFILENGEVGNIQIFRSIERTAEILRVLIIVLIIVSVMVMVPVVISSRVLSRLITAPILSMIRTMTDIRKSGQFRQLEINNTSNDELQEMAVTFNHMIELLEGNYEKQKQFTSNASHELRTPITIIESYANLLKRRGKQDPKIWDESIEAIHSEALRMKDLTEQLLLLTKSNEEWTMNLEQIHINALIRSTINDFENAYQRDVFLKEETDVLIKSDHQKLKQLLYIFLDNARKYSDDVIEIVVGKNDGLFIQIKDRGIGMSEAELKKVFERFYRVDKARNRKTGGIGLGLTIAKEMANALSIRIEMNSVEQSGTTVTLLFDSQSVVEQGREHS
ncbi:sensor histidine kinase [Alkalihalobacillus pseudalcaliphilus]|uniref:sensor histidine kinase n=1 Tax=Alkalihalobacillus pseudalcaliphilus TaxID=79884 RepID=UPI00064D9AA2|nr:HAMP domain-containing sensor histidine kinase [Alkalihalobacillus pseudalcaliphilus]KMK75215.1 hypothetical protein AB990_17440 [Alkalihalobacillus pseudalcaliphilus]